MNNDNVVDILAGHHCIYYTEGTYKTCSIDESYPTLSRIAGGQFIAGGTPEVLIASGDRSNVINMYSITDNNLCGNWVKKTVEAESKSRHTLQVGDINNDGNVDFFSGSTNATSPVEVFYSDGQGNFTKQVVMEVLPMHESKLDDIDGDGDLDLICKSLFTGTKATFNIFLNNGSGTVSVKNNQLNRQNTLTSKQNVSMAVYNLQGKKVQAVKSADAKVHGVTLVNTNNGIIKQIER
jgi:hypothetical protein